MAVSNKERAKTAQCLSAIHSDNARYHRDRYIETGHDGHLDAYHEEARYASKCARHSRYVMGCENYYAIEGNKNG